MTIRHSDLLFWATLYSSSVLIHIIKAA